MADNKQYDFKMSFAGEGVFDVWRFGWDPKGYHDEPKEGAQSDSLTAAFLGRRYSLQHLCSMVDSQQTMLITKPSDLVTVRLVEMFLKKEKIKELYFVVSESANKGRTPVWVAHLYMKNVSITNLKARLQLGVLPTKLDMVALEAESSFNRSYDSQGNMEIKGWEND